MSASKLAEACRAALRHTPKSSMVEAILAPAIAAHDAAQAGGERVRIAVAGDGERWAAAGVSGEDDADIMDRARNAFGRYYGENSAPLCFIEATLPPRQPVPVVEGSVVDG